MVRKLLSGLGLAFAISSAASAQQANNVDYRALGAPLPAIRIISEAGKVYTEKDALSGENLFIMLFNPTCDHCQEATHMLGKNADKFKDGQLYLVAAPGMLDYLEFFGNVTRHKQHPVIRVGVDSAGLIEKTFNYQTLPELLIYDRSRRLTRSMSSGFSIDSLLPYLGPTARQYMPASTPVAGPFPVTTPAQKKRNR